jgi:O-antigen/teichoic acid export membrane protein
MKFNGVPGPGRIAVSDVTITALSQGIKVIVGMATTILMARLLKPHDFGLVAMVAPILSFVVIFQDLGLQQALVQAREISHEQINTLFWITFFVSVVIACFLSILGFPASWFFGERELIPLVSAYAAPLLLQALTAQHLALLNRGLKFASIAVSDIAGSVANLVFGVFLAWLLGNYWALWGAAVASSLATLAVAWTSSGWRPSFPKLSGSSRLLHFGLHLAGFNITNYFSRNLDDVIVARLFGAVSLGFYDRAYRLLLAPLQNINAPVSRLVLPLLGRLQEEPTRYRATFMHSGFFVIFACAPGITALGVLSDQFVPFLLGSRWAPTGPIFAWLALSGIVQPLGNATGWLFISQHRTSEMFRWGILSSVLTIISFLAGVPWGTVGVAAAYSLGTVIVRTPLLIAWSGRRGPVTVRDLVHLQLPAVGSAILTWLLARHVTISLHPPILLEMMIVVFFSYSATLAFSLLSSDGRASVSLAYNVLRRQPRN